jgi:hypothetical protein
MFSIGGRQKRAFVMVEPPRDLRRTRIFEIDDCVFVAVELIFVEKSTGTMHEAGKFEFSIVTDPLAVKARKQRRRRSTVKTFVVVKDAYAQCNAPIVAKDPAECHTAREAFVARGKLIGLPA